MRIIDGLEMTCFTKSRQFEIEYGGKGLYLDRRGEPVDDVMDMACYVCTASYYTRESEPIAFCPNCGAFDRKRFQAQEDIAAFLREYSFAWLGPKGMKPFIVQIPDGSWELRYAKSHIDLEQKGAYLKVVNVG